MSVAKLISNAVHKVPGKFEISELFFNVPKDYRNPQSGTLQLFARAAKDATKSNDEKPKPWRGPGQECRSPQNFPFVRTFLDKGYHVLFLDQRGTGLSSPISSATLAKAAPGGPTEQANYLSLFRADSIVEDCEAIRRLFMKDYPDSEPKKWSLIGQSYGGFCSVAYLSRYPGSLKEVFMTGGIPPLIDNPDKAYEQTYKKLHRRNEIYYNKYPEDIKRVRDLLEFFLKEDITLPSGGKLTGRRFQQLGLVFGFHGSMDTVHDLILRAHNEMTNYGVLTRMTLSSIDGFLGFDERPIYTLLHEPLYCQGQASNWSAERIRQKHDHFFLERVKDSDKPIYFTGEMIYPFMLDDYSELAKMKEAANLLATKSDWPRLYDEEQLARNDVPVYAATYLDDMYVDFELAQATASKIKGCRQFITNVMYHDSLRSKNEEVMKQLFAMKEDVLD